MSKTVGARELKTRLGKYLRLVREGETLVVTDRGRPVAVIRPVEPAEDDEAAMLEEMIALGQASLESEEPLPRFRPVRVKGEPVSRTVAEGREDRS